MDNPQPPAPRVSPVSDISPAQQQAATPAPAANPGPQVSQVSGGKFFSAKRLLIGFLILLLIGACGVGIYLYYTQPTPQDSTQQPQRQASSSKQSTAPASDQQLESDLSSVDTGLGSAGSDLSGAGQGISDQQPNLSQ